MAESPAETARVQMQSDRARGVSVDCPCPAHGPALRAARGQALVPGTQPLRRRDRCLYSGL